MAQDAGLEITNDPKTGSGEHIHTVYYTTAQVTSPRPPLLVVRWWWETKPTTASVELDPSDGKNRGRTPPPDKEMRRLEKKLQSTFDVSGSDL